MPAPDPELVRLVEEWKKTKDPETFSKIYQKLKPYVSYSIGKYKNSGISSIALDLEARKLIAQALENYNASKGGVVTYVNQYLQKMNRFVNDNQGMLRLPENYNLEFSTFQQAYNDLRYKKDREPTVLELSDELSWEPKKIETFKRQMGGVVLESADAFNKLYGNENLEIMEALQYIRSKYGADGEMLISKLYGLNGETKQSLMNIARETKKDYNELYKLKKNVEKDFKDYLS